MLLKFIYKKIIFQYTLYTKDINIIYLIKKKTPKQFRGIEHIILSFCKLASLIL